MFSFFLSHPSHLPEYTSFLEHGHRMLFKGPIHWNWTHKIQFNAASEWRQLAAILYRYRYYLLLLYGRPGVDMWSFYYNSDIIGKQHFIILHSIVRILQFQLHWSNCSQLTTLDRYTFAIVIAFKWQSFWFDFHWSHISLKSVAINN